MVGQRGGEHPEHPGPAPARRRLEGVLHVRGERERVPLLQRDLLAGHGDLVLWTALNLVDFFFVRRGHYAITDIFSPEGVYGAWGWRGLTAYFVGFAAEIPFMVLPPIFGLSYTGWIPNHVTNGVDYSWVIGLLVSGLVYLVLSRSLDLAAEQEAIKASERELQAIDQETR